jgi:hypothetical protein
MHGVLVVQRMDRMRSMRRRRVHGSVIFMALARNRGPRHVQVQQRQSQQNGGDAFQAHMRILAGACVVGSGR